MELPHEVDPSRPPSYGCCSLLSPFPSQRYVATPSPPPSYSKSLLHESCWSSLSTSSQNRRLLLFSSPTIASNCCKFSSPSTPSNAVAAASALLLLLLLDNHQRHCCCCKCSSPSPSLGLIGISALDLLSRTCPVRD